MIPADVYDLAVRERDAFRKAKPGEMKGPRATPGTDRDEDLIAVARGDSASWCCR